MLVRQDNIEIQKYWIAAYKVKVTLKVSGTIQPFQFVTKLCRVVYYHELECHAKNCSPEPFNLL